MEKVSTALTVIFLSLINNLADILLYAGLTLIGVAAYMTFGIVFTIFYCGVLLVMSAFVFNLTSSQNNGRK